MRIFITGGSGSLGMALLAHYERQGHTCTVYSRDEVKQSEARRLYPGHRFVLGDVRNTDWLEVCMRGHDLVIHAAAYKQIPAAESNVGEAIETNVVGSRNVAMAAVQAGVRRVVGVSTDKACEPVNAYGATKALMEKLFQQANNWVTDGGTTFTLVRYGNVLNSRGSVVPLFRSQIERGQRLTVTNGAMTRFWLTLVDAIELIELAAVFTTPGAIVIPKAPASTMHAMAEAAVLKYHQDSYPYIDTREIGVRPGEKMHEKLVHAGESMHAIAVGSYMVVLPPDFENGLDIPGACNLVPGYEYTSDQAVQLDKVALSKML